VVSGVRSVDTVTLGAGGGAYPAAFALAASGQRVVMVDAKGVMSGNCLAEGCVPSKAVFEMAELRRRLRLGPMAHALGPLAAPTDYRAVLAHKADVQRTRYRQHDEELAAAGDRLQLVHGTARLVDAHVVEVVSDTGLERFRAEHVIIATGSDVFVPPIPGAELCATSHDLFALDATVTSLPERLVVIGGGYVGLEVACMLQGLGSTVTVLEALDQVLAGMDPDFVTLLSGGLDPSVTVKLGAGVTAITKAGQGLEVHYRHDGVDHQLGADLVLMAVGRRPVIPAGADSIGLALDGHALAVGPSLQVPSHRHIYAPGDVNGRSPLFHSAVRQSLVARGRRLDAADVAMIQLVRLVLDDGWDATAAAGELRTRVQNDVVLRSVRSRVSMAQACRASSVGRRALVTLDVALTRDTAGDDRPVHGSLGAEVVAR